MKTFKAFIKPFKALQRSVKINILNDFSLTPKLGREGLILNANQLILFRSRALTLSQFGQAHRKNLAALTPNVLKI